MLLFWLLPSINPLFIVTNCCFPPQAISWQKWCSILPNSTDLSLFQKLSLTTANLTLHLLLFSLVSKRVKHFFKKLNIDWGKRRSSKCLYLSTVICEAGFSLSGIRWRAAIQPEVSVGTLQNIWTSAWRTYLKNNHAQQRRNIWCCTLKTTGNTAGISKKSKKLI